MRPAMLSGRTIPEIVRFCSVGLLNTAAGLVIIWLLMWFGVGVYAANLLGYGAGMVISFTLNRNWTFRQDKPTRSADILRFLLACAVSYGLNLMVVAGLLAVGFPAYPAQLAGLPAYTACFFLLSKYFVFGTPLMRRGASTAR